MALDREHLEYPRRSYGMDHDRYDWSMLTDRPAVQWPDGKRLALWVNVCLQFFPLNQQGKPFAAPGGMTMPYPDLRHFSLRDYGNRVGIYRFLKAFDSYGIKPSFAINSALAERAPALLRTIANRGDEILAHGIHMDALHYGGQDEAEERALVAECLSTLREASGQPVTGWLSPARNESERTPELLVEHGVEYFCDWVNDDMPYRFHTDNGGLWAMPLSNELEDHFVIMNNQHSEQSWLEQVCDACDFLLKEAEQTGGGRILALNLHPWMLGQPHRIAKLEQALEYITRQQGVWSVSPGKILSTFTCSEG
ncbi:polysaccharide deacetylase family protein [Microbulbifer bruguierae]|uniref:Polysaccharide deacetylase family protein n=1 Tax=Microbulbifer bruguierae TaxID=3029061 RepID=A0ABY8NBI3_9GAMM|nr:polysaccharide deacetylase family protein [Microbulbifer bruguierae]WGL16286.1 polysaccharide deacetylase family protein [Microbulbifer bruguierae]